MSLAFRILNGLGRKRYAAVDDQNALVVTNTACPPMIEQKNIIFSQYLTNSGNATGDSQMSTGTTGEFFIPSHVERDRYITQISFAIIDAGAGLNEFGNIAALTNGCRFYYTRGGGQEVDIKDGLKSNWDFVRMCRLNPAWGDAGTAFIAQNVTGASEAFAPVMNFLDILPPYGLKLDKGSEQKLALEVRDDTSGVDGFDAIGYGFERFE